MNTTEDTWDKVLAQRQHRRAQERARARCRGGPGALARMQVLGNPGLERQRIHRDGAP